MATCHLPFYRIQDGHHIAPPKSRFQHNFVLSTAEWWCCHLTNVFDGDKYKSEVILTVCSHVDDENLRWPLNWQYYKYQNNVTLRIENTDICVASMRPPTGCQLMETAAQFTYII